jgi:hypothetical protein
MITLRRLGIATALVVTAIAAPAVPVGAATTRVSGTAVFDHTGATCPKNPPAGYGTFTSYDPLVLSGDLQGCWYTKIERAWDLGPPSGLYFEVGREVFKGSVLGGPVGTFSTVYSFESQWDPDAATGTEIWGHCEHPIVPGTGAVGLRGITGYLGFIDIVSDGSYTYSGFVRQR